VVIVQVLIEKCQGLGAQEIGVPHEVRSSAVQGWIAIRSLMTMEFLRQCEVL